MALGSRTSLRIGVLVLTALVITSIGASVEETNATETSRPVGAQAQATDTVLLFGTPISLTDLEMVLRPSGADVIAFEHVSPDRGGFRTVVPLRLSDAVGSYRDGLVAMGRGSEARVFAARLRGTPELTSGTPLAAIVVASLVIPSDSIVALAPYGAAHPIDVFRRQPRTSASRFGRPPGLAVIPSAPPWSPAFGRVDAMNLSGTRGMIVHDLTWESQSDIDAFGEDAYEHDFKLWNRANPEFCFPWQTNDFWLTRGSLTWGTNFPSVTKPYLDTQFLDPCTEMDLTIGLFWPKFLSPNVTFTITVIADRGDTASSPMTLAAQRVTKTGSWCDFDPFCAIQVNGHHALVRDTEASAPACRTWKRGDMPSEPCP